MKFDIKEVADWLVGIGALNWGLDSLLNFNVVARLGALVPVPSFDKIVYGAVGIAGGYFLARKLKLV